MALQQKQAELHPKPNLSNLVFIARSADKSEIMRLGSAIPTSNWQVFKSETHHNEWQLYVGKGEEEAKALLLHLANSEIAINANDELEQDWLLFEVGTDKVDIWHWIEYEFSVSIATLI